MDKQNIEKQNLAFKKYNVCVHFFIQQRKNDNNKFLQPTVLILKCDGFSTSSVSDSRNAFAPDNDDDDDDG